MSLLYYPICALFIANFAASAVMTHVVATKIKSISRGLHLWIMGILVMEGVVAMLSFFSLTHTDDVVFGAPVLVWLIVAYAIVFSSLNAWVLAFHFGTKRWRQKDA